jgi:hypothetical protein
MPLDVLACVRDASLRAALAAAAGQAGWSVHVDSALPEGDVIAALVDLQPRLIVIEAALDADASSWAQWIMAVKSSSATRKMPVALIVSATDAFDAAERGRKAGALNVTRQDVLRDAVTVLEPLLRPDESAELARQAALPLPALARAAVLQFNARKFWEQHETFEAVWRAEPGPIRQMYQGVLQVGVAYLQIQRGNYAGARKLFQRARQYLIVLPEIAQGMDIGQLRQDAQTAQGVLESLGPERISEFPTTLMRPIRLVGDPT